MAEPSRLGSSLRQSVDMMWRSYCGFDFMEYYLCQGFGFRQNGHHLVSVEKDESSTHSVRVLGMLAAGFEFSGVANL